MIFELDAYDVYMRCPYIHKHGLCSGPLGWYHTKGNHVSLEAAIRYLLKQLDEGNSNE